MAQLLTSIVAVALVVASQAGAKPNFSGEWTMDAARSNFGALPPPTTLTRSIKHDEPKLTIVERQVSALGDQTATRSYVTDGTKTTFEAQGAIVPTSATWNDNALVVVSSVEEIGLTFNDRMTLSPDGMTLTSVVQVSSPQGDLEMTVVFERAQ